MNLASSSNGDLTSAAIGLAVAGVFSLFEDTPKKENTIIKGTNLQMGFFPYVVYNFLKLLIGSPRNHF